MVELLRVRLRDLLYRTRGRDWDYGFLLQPEPLLGEGWYAIHRRIFANLEPGLAPALLRGALGIGTGHAFFATAFVDPRRRDYQERPIAHYLTWIGQTAEDAPGLSFGPALVDALEPALSSVFELSPDSVRRGETKALDTLIRNRFRAELPGSELTIECSPGEPIHWLGTIAP
jgi:hypothetical protein